LFGKHDYALQRLLLGNALRRNDISQLSVRDFELASKTLGFGVRDAARASEVVDLGLVAVRAITDWLEARGSFSHDSPLFIALDSAHSGHRRKRRRYLQDGCPPQGKCWYQKTDVPSPHPTLRYHGGAGRDGWECKKSAETQQTQKFKHLDGVCDNRGPDQRDITDLLDGMKGAIGGGSG